MTFRESKRNRNETKYLASDYSVVSIKCVKNTQSPFMNAHNICINSSMYWKIFLESGKFNIHYPHNSSNRSISFFISLLDGLTKSML